MAEHRRDGLGWGLKQRMPNEGSTKKGWLLRLVNRLIAKGN